jgi:mono/diheme cytochrome c family protein
MNTCKTIVLTLIALLTASVVFCQGEQLFKAKCNTCHLVDRASTGPWLKGVHQKWADAGEGELLYKWVGNSIALINSGQSKLALAIKDFNAGEMPPQQVTPKEIDAILAYVDSYEAPKTDTTGLTAATTGAGKDYEGNLTLFYWLVALLIFLLITIVIMANTILSLLRSDLFRDRLPAPQPRNKRPGWLLMIALLAYMTIAGNPLYAFDFVDAGSTTEKTPRLLIDSFDLYVMLGIDVVLIGVVFYLKSLFDGLVKLVR